MHITSGRNVKSILRSNFFSALDFWNGCWKPLLFPPVSIAEEKVSSDECLCSILVSSSLLSDIYLCMWNRRVLLYEIDLFMPDLYMKTKCHLFLHTRTRTQDLSPHDFRSISRVVSWLFPRRIPGSNLPFVGKTKK